MKNLNSKYGCGVLLSVVNCRGNILQLLVKYWEVIRFKYCTTSITENRFRTNKKPVRQFSVYYNKNILFINKLFKDFINTYTQLAAVVWPHTTFKENVVNLFYLPSDNLIRKRYLVQSFKVKLRSVSNTVSIEWPDNAIAGIRMMAGCVLAA